MKITGIVQTEWLIQRVLRQLRAIPGIGQVYQEQQTPHLVSVVAIPGSHIRYEFYFTRHSGGFGGIKFYSRHPYTEAIRLPENLTEAISQIEKECRSGRNLLAN